MNIPLLVIPLMLEMRLGGLDSGLLVNLSKEEFLLEAMLKQKPLHRFNEIMTRLIYQALNQKNKITIDEKRFYAHHEKKG